jgi:hypothetical protein
VLLNINGSMKFEIFFVAEGKALFTFSKDGDGN